MTDLEKRIEEVLADYAEKVRHVMPPGGNPANHVYTLTTAQSLKQLFIEWAEGQEHLLMPGQGTSIACSCGRSFPTTNLAQQHQTLNNLKEKQ